MSQTLSWIADVLLMLMLCGTLVATVKLDRALRIVGRDRTAFETLISSLGAATEAVNLGIQALRTEADRAAGQIERRSEDADKMATDLSFLIEAADRAGARLEQRLSSIPPAAVEESRPIAVARKLLGGGRYRRTRRPSADGLAAEPSGNPMPPSESMQKAPMMIGKEMTPSGSLQSTSAALRELAGITTRRRAMDSDMTELGRPGPTTSLSEASRDVSPIKLVG